MAKVQVYIPLAKKRKCCAFCKHWYDPANSNIKMLSGARIEFDNAVSKPCELKGGFNMVASMTYVYFNAYT